MPSNSILFARQLRRNATDVERMLWARLRRRQLDGHKFRRQAPIGPYTVDFVCLERSLVIELDGSQHADSDVGHDRVRDDYLERRGFQVLRFWNEDISRRLDDVMQMIWLHLQRGRVPVASTTWGAPPPLRGTSPLRGEDSSS